MCAILDANVVGQVFGKRRPPAGRAFFDWIETGRGRLVIGGKLWRELGRTKEFREQIDHWREKALAGRITFLNDEEVDHRAGQLEQQ